MYFKLNCIHNHKYVPTAQFNGISLFLQNATLGIGPLVITSQREELIDFSKPFMALSLGALVQSPTLQEAGTMSSTFYSIHLISTSMIKVIS